MTIKLIALFFLTHLLVFILGILFSEWSAKNEHKHAWRAGRLLRNMMRLK